MKILLADSDRDLLQCYQKLLTMDGHTVTTAFDGAQAVSLLGQEAFDIAVLEESLPRIRNELLLRAMQEKRIPVIVLSDGRVTVKKLLNPTLPNAYLPFPFLPADLADLLRAVTEKARSGESFSCCGVEVDVSGFCFSGAGAPLTNGEIDLLKELGSARKVSGKRTRIMIQALNEKLKRIGKPTRIIYEMEKGYRLVNGND